MAQDSAQERSEAPTPRRREEARRKGQVARSADLASTATLLGGALALWFGASAVGRYLQDVTRTELSLLGRGDLTIAQAQTILACLLQGVAANALPILAVTAFITVAVSLAQAGFHVSFEPLAPDWSRISLSKGWSRIASLSSLMRTFMFFAKVLALTATVSWLAYKSLDQWTAIAPQSLGGSVGDAWAAALFCIFATAAVLFVLAGLDYAFQRWRHEDDLKMSLQQVRDDHKEDDGDPKTKQRMRSLQREAAKLRMLRDVPAATVVLTNPTHIAVALQYDRHAMSAPKVIAKGTGAFAKRIVHVAESHGIPVLQRKPLARALFASVDVNQEIPATLYKAIAEILAYIYGLRRPA